MKKLLLFLFLGIWGTSVYSQNIHVISTIPANGAFNVDQDSIVLIFDAPIEFNVNDPDSSGFSFVIEPEDSVMYNYLTINEDSTKVTAFMDLADNTDYFGILLGVQGKNGETLETPYVFNFTTADAAGLYSISGTLDAAYLESNENYNGMVMTLSAIPFELNIELEDSESDSTNSDSTNTDDQEDEGLDFIPLYAASVNTTTGEYSVSGIREGTYFPMAINAFKIEAADNNTDMNEDEFFFPDLFIYDPNADLLPEELIINDSTTTDDQIMDVDLTFLDFSPLTFSEAIEIASNGLENYGSNLSIMGGSTSYFSGYGAPTDPPQKRSKKSVFESNTSQKAPFQQFKYTQNTYKAADAPDGSNLFWEIYIYDAAKDSALGLMVMPFGQILMGYFSEEDVEIDVEFKSIKPLPDTYIDSDEAIAIAEANGGAEFRAKYSTPKENSYGGIEIDLSSLHEYWTYSPDPTPNAPQFWRVEYSSYSYNYSTEEFTEDSLNIYMNLANGDVLLPTSIERGSFIPDKITLSQNFPNPFNPSTNISFSVNKNTKVELSVYNLLGQKVTELVNDVYPAGVHSVQWEAQKMASGVYIYRLNAGGTTMTRKMLLLK